MHNLVPRISQVERHHLSCACGPLRILLVDCRSLHCKPQQCKKKWVMFTSEGLQQTA